MTKKFKIGDIVEANEASNVVYNRTTLSNGWRGKVTRVGESSFAAETIAGSTSKIGAAYLGLSPKYFDLVTSNAPKQSIEIIEGLTVELTAEQLEEVSRKLQSAKDKSRKGAMYPKPKVGDWIRAIGDGSGITDGKAYEVFDNTTPGFARVIDDYGNKTGVPYGDFEIIDKLTPFDRAGRKPNEFKKGDIVCVTTDIHEHRVGDLYIILNRKPNAFDYAVAKRLDGDWSGCIDAKNIELVTPVESRVDRAEGGERA